MNKDYGEELHEQVSNMILLKSVPANKLYIPSSGVRISNVALGPPLIVNAETESMYSVYGWALRISRLALNDSMILSALEFSSVRFTVYLLRIPLVASMGGGAQWMWNDRDSKLEMARSTGGSDGAKGCKHWN